MICIAGISLLVGGIGIMNIMLATVLERTREIGIRRAIGARQSDIVRQFLTEAVLISIVGGLIGIAFGFSLSKLIAVFAGWSTVVTWQFDRRGVWGVCVHRTAVRDLSGRAGREAGSDRSNPVRVVRISMKLRFTVLALVCAVLALSAAGAHVSPAGLLPQDVLDSHGTHVELQPPVRLADFVVDGKLELSLRSYLDLVMANNTDIAVQKLSVETVAGTTSWAPSGGLIRPLRGHFTNHALSRHRPADQLEGSAVSKTLSRPLSFTYNQTLPDWHAIQRGLQRVKDIEQQLVLYVTTRP